jgi:hypothetical protein
MDSSKDEEEQPKDQVHGRKTLLIEGKLSGPGSSLVQESKSILELHGVGVVAVGNSNVPIVRSCVINKLLEMGFIVEKSVISFGHRDLLFAR